MALHHLLLNILLKSFLRLVACLLHNQRSRDRSSGPAHSFVENNFPLPLIQEELVVSYWRKKWVRNTGELPPRGLT